MDLRPKFFAIEKDSLTALMNLTGLQVKSTLDAKFGGISGLCEKLSSSASSGITEDSVQMHARQETFGTNRPSEKEPDTYIQRALRGIKAVKQPMLIIFLLAAVTSLALSLYAVCAPEDAGQEVGNNKTSNAGSDIVTIDGTVNYIIGSISPFKPSSLKGDGTQYESPKDNGTHYENPKDNGTQYEWITFLLILAAVIIIILVTAITEFGLEARLRGLQDRIHQQPRVLVVRDGQDRQVAAADLVVGDICMLNYGDIAPADGLVVTGQELRMDESPRTGELDLVIKGPDGDIRILSGGYKQRCPPDYFAVWTDLPVTYVYVTRPAQQAIRGCNLKESHTVGISAHVVHGSGKMLVTAVGFNSPSGTVSAMLSGVGSKGRKKARLEAKDKNKVQTTAPRENDTKQEDSDRGLDTGEGDQSGWRKKLMLTALIVGMVGLMFAVAIALNIIIEFCYKHVAGGWSHSDVFKILDGIIIGIAILVVALPEGLLLAIILTLALAGKKLLNDRIMVNNMYVCEAMGRATTVCSAKAGTITTSRMTVTKTYIGGKIFTPLPEPSAVDGQLLQLIMEAISVNSNYTSDIIAGPRGEPSNQNGNGTECALLQFVHDAGFDYKSIRKQHPEDSLTKVYTFNSNRKSMTTVISTDRGWRVLSKGGTEMMIARCDFFLNASGKAEEFSEQQKHNILDTVVSQMAAEGLRTLCVAYKDIPASTDNMDNAKTKINPDFNDEKAVTSGLTCLAIFGIYDRIRDNVQSVMKRCAAAGVTVRMVTGDSAAAAQSIALEYGIISSNDGSSKDAVLESDEFNKRIRGEKGKFDQRLFDKVWPNIRVLARSTPEDKHRLVAGIKNSRATTHREGTLHALLSGCMFSSQETLRRLLELFLVTNTATSQLAFVVAMMGSGASNSAALKKADIGFAMGIAGTGVAREASDIILVDDNLTGIVNVTMWGRNIYDNICKFLQFQLTVSFSALVLCLVCAAYFGRTPLKAVPLVWINLMQDTLAAIALSTEPPTEGLLARKPYGRNYWVISATMVKNIVGQGCYQLLVLFLLAFGREKGLFDFLHPHGSLTEAQADTMVFNILVYMNLFNLINSRCVHGERNVFAGLLDNRVFLGILLLMVGLQAVVVQLSGPAFQSAPLNWQEWVACIIMGALSLVWYQILVSVPVEGVFKRKEI